MSAFNWTCPFCDRAQTVVEKRYSATADPFYTSEPGADGLIGVERQRFVCSNAGCEKSTINLAIVKYRKNASGQYVRDFSEPDLFARQVIPEGAAKVLADFVPKAIRDDYDVTP